MTIIQITFMVLSYLKAAAVTILSCPNGMTVVVLYNFQSSVKIRPYYWQITVGLS